MSFYWRFVRPISFALEAFGGKRPLRAFFWRCWYGARLMLRGR